MTTAVGSKGTIFPLASAIAATETSAESSTAIHIRNQEGKDVPGAAACGAGTGVARVKARETRMRRADRCCMILRRNSDSIDRLE